MKKLIFLAIFLILSRKVYAKFTRFDFSLGRYLVDEKKEIKVNFRYELSNYEEKDFLVRPISGSGIIEIYDIGENKWVSSFSIISDFPNLKKEMLIKITGLNIQNSSIYFEIYNIRTGEIISTPSKEIWSKNLYSSYLDKLNSSLSKYSLLKEESKGLSVFLQSTESSDSEEKRIENIFNNIPEIHFLYLGIFIFIISSYMGFKIKIKNRKKKLEEPLQIRNYYLNGKIH